MKTWVQNLTSQNFGSGEYSQFYQDALLDYIFANAIPDSVSPFCVEFGFDGASFHDGGGSNVAKLVLERGWQCLLLDGGYSNPAINLHQYFLTPGNIVEIFRRYGVPGSPEYISIDVDSLDFWLFRSLLMTYRPMVYSVEYNAHFPLWAAITVDNDPNFRWQRDRLYGASLKALTLLANEHGYSLLWVVPKVDAFFIRNDLVDDGSDTWVHPFSAWRRATNLRVHPRVRNIERLKCLIDYESIGNKTDIRGSSKDRAFDVGRRYLAGHGDFETLTNYISAIPSKCGRRFQKILK
jgi:hypothetical protein